jgi:transcriptional regulator with XRE-family HTH domain
MIICNNEILFFYIYLRTIYQVIRIMKSVTAVNKNDFNQSPVDSYEIYKKMQAITYTVGQRLKTARLNKNLSRQQLAAEIGMYQTICRIEVGVFEQLDAVYTIAQFLEVNISDLFAEPFTYSEKPSYGAICRENKILKKMLDDQRSQNKNR